MLIIEDSKTVGAIVYRLLHSYGYNPHLVSSTYTIQPLIKTYKPTCVILNTFLEHADAQLTCETIRATLPNAFILALHTRGTWQNRIDILKKGADDCITFPFPGEELLARINALLRRPKLVHLPTLTTGSLTLIPDDRKAFYKESPLDLSRTEYRLLEYLVRNSNRTVTRSELLDNVWDYTRIINSNTVDVHIQKLRKKLHNEKEHKKEHKESTPKLKSSSRSAPDKSSSDTEYSTENFTQLLEEPVETDTHIKTVHGIGYRLEGTFSRSSSA